MNNIKNKFSIKDLENLTGIKAHTIRIWEKRYNLLQPKRTDTNIRYYDLASFQKLLNVTYLNSNGYKISKIATLDNHQIPVLVREIASQNNVEGHAINSFKLSMLNFDQILFYNTYESLLKEKSFTSIFYDIFIPLLTEIGLLWQTDTITPAHEHFLTTLIRQKILVNIENIQSNKINKSKRTFILYLPSNEIHELGLMFLNYEIVSKGYHSIFLGQSVPQESLKDVLNYYDDIVFLSYFTVKPYKEDLDKYIKNFSETILQNSNSEFWILGQMLNHIDIEKLPKNIKTFKSIKSVVSIL
ncbi:MerR family transcriptional regulator [Winogradskyella immobilis]|uniref:MerR family transcriptional regulator n=1 Tax=Winogradskyella immobilis TaxID=2816852 RepID=A0ABS8EPD7_9FLAO|nr:MerR family transcriptional regulator [Winogradskyella immobilis]MCC1485023.1 MerR family transcriptional regulator [Winogradskyella immobilis]MCG0017115.1 MerR family transcriptional regulator [Winogradskyella immobilis]